MSIDLAPHNPYGLTVRSAVLGRCGGFGAGIDRLANLSNLGAIITDPLGTRDQAIQLIPTPGGLLYRSSTRTWRRAQRDAAHWQTLDLPVLLCLQPRSIQDLQELLRNLHEGEWAAVLLDLEQSSELNHLARWCELLRNQWEAPLLIQVATDQISQLNSIPQMIDGLVLGSGPRAKHESHYGRLVGPAIEPLLGWGLERLRELTEKPLICSAPSLASINTLPAIGAQAIIFDSLLWTTAPQQLPQINL
jgi:dihydroorotate dehydrogenase (NAD+) catalytic subunit